ncbi:MAG: hypothetical protein ABW067_20320 [Rhizobacter sp.]
MTSRTPYLDIAVTWADEELNELKVSAASERFAGEVDLYASPDDLRDTTDRLRAFLNGRSERRDFLLGQEDFAGFGTARIDLHRKLFADTATVEVTLRTNPGDRHTHAESCLVRLSVPVADLERFEVELRRIAQRQGTRARLAAT